MMIDLRNFLGHVEEILDSHRLDRAGAYRRWNWHGPGTQRDLGLNP